jgi:nitrate/TMAO reductase-like tetraheme cytochrome c subunit
MAKNASSGTSGPSTGARRVRRIVVWGAVAVLAVLAIAGSFVYTEQSSFCPWCHEMVPYYQAWRSGGHASSAQCVDCHVDPGLLAHIAHKPIALKEVWDHFFSSPTFPNYSVDIPNSRCERCHPNVATNTGALFSHAFHETKATCKDCHATAGHEVSLQSLSDAGVLKAAATTPPVPAGMTPSSIPAHIKVICQECHNQAAMKCTTCHQAPHEPRGECSNCHQPGTAFRFVHPAATASCGDCHTPPAGHYPGTDCKACHTPTVAFAKAVFAHPSNTGRHTFQSFPCVKCHPGDVYTSASCTCHGGNPPRGD